MFARWRNELLEKARAAATDDERVDLYVIYILTDPSRVDAAVATDIAAIRGIPDPVRMLTAPK